MNSYIEEVSQHIWNFEFEKADLSADIPRIATLRGLKYLLKATVTDNPLDRQIALKELDNAMKICKSFSGKKEKIRELALQIASMNEQVTVARFGGVGPVHKDQQEQGSMEDESQQKSLGILNKSELMHSSLYPVSEDSDGSGTGFENLHQKLSPRPVPLTNAEVIADNLELDLGVTMATINLWIAIVQFLSRNFLNGGLSMRKSWKKYNSLQKEIEKNRGKYEQDVVDSIEAGIGAFLYSVSVIPGGLLKSVLKVIGFKEDQEQGVSLLWDVLFHQGSEIPMVFLVLAANYLFLASEIDLESSLSTFRPVLEYCLHRYETGLTFRFVANVFVKKTGHVETALHHLRTGIDHCETNARFSSDPIVPISLYIDYSQAFMYLFEYGKAEEVLNKAFLAPFDFTKKGLVALHLAVCQLQLGKEDNLDFLLQEMARLAKNHKQETFTNTKAKLVSLCKSNEERNLLLNISAFEMMVYWREIPFISRERINLVLERFEERIGRKVKHSTIPDFQIASYVIRGQILVSMGEKIQARDNFLLALEMKKKIKHERQWIAFAHFELANMDLEREDYESALENLKQIFNSKSFPFDDILQTRAKALEKKIEKREICDDELI